MGRRRVKFDTSPLTEFEKLPLEDRSAILSALSDFSEAKISAAPVKDHPDEFGLGADRNWAITLVERDGIFFVIDLANEP